VSESAEKHKAEAPKKLRFGIFICSTSRYQQSKKGHSVTFRKLIPDDKAFIEKGMRQALASADLDAAVFCGGTGIAHSDITIETVLPFLEKVLPGFGEIFRRLSFDRIGSAAVLSRAIAGVAKGKAFFCVPGSPDAVTLCFERLILPEAGHTVKHARE
jgi:molybdenum cofactor biosynthesis protein B